MESELNDLIKIKYKRVDSVVGTEFILFSSLNTKVKKIFRSMRALLKKRILGVCCYLLTASISLSPVVHASYMSSLNAESEETVQESHTGHPHKHTNSVSADCHHQEFDIADAMESCDHDSDLSCKILCTVSISTILTAPIGGIPSNRPGKWLADHGTQHIQPIPLSLFKPPRS